MREHERFSTENKKKSIRKFMRECYPMVETEWDREKQIKNQKKKKQTAPSFNVNRFRRVEEQKKNKTN